MRTKMLLAIVCVLLLVSTTAADPGDTLWTRTYGGSSLDRAYCVQQTSDGGYILAGGTYSFGAGYEDFYLVKTDSSGDTLWTRTYGGSSEDRCNSVHQTADGGFITVGYTHSFGAGGKDVYLVKTDSSGDTLWTRTYGGGRYDEGYSVLQTSDSGYIIAGYTDSFGPGNDNVWLLKTDSSGDTLWTRTYGLGNYAQGRSVQLTSDGGYVIAGHIFSYSTHSHDVYLLKTDSSGDTLWTRTYGASDHDYGYSVQQTADGGYVIAGYTYYHPFYVFSDVYLVKTDSSGETLWTRTYDRETLDHGYSVQQTSDGGYIIAGETWPSGGGGYDVYLLKTDSSGDTLWTRIYGGVCGDDYGYSVQQTSDGAYIIAGWTDSFGAGGYDVYLIKTVGEVVGVDDPEFESSLPASTSLSQCYPNPFNASTTINYQLPIDAYVRLDIYNLLGEKVASLADKRQQAGYKSVNWDAQEVSSGLYFYKLTAGDYTETRRMMLVK
jgi:hypothetical protein